MQQYHYLKFNWKGIWYIGNPYLYYKVQFGKHNAENCVGNAREGWTCYIHFKSLNDNTKHGRPKKYCSKIFNRYKNYLLVTWIIWRDTSTKNLTTESTYSTSSTKDKNNWHSKTKRKALKIYMKSSQTIFNCSCIYEKTQVWPRDEWLWRCR